MEVFFRNLNQLSDFFHIYIYTPSADFCENKGGIYVNCLAEDYRNIMNGIKVEGFETRKLPF